MKRRLLLIAYVVCLVLPLQGQASALRFHHINVEDGLSHSLVSSMAEDSMGFIWLGTQDGLNRYDGIRFKSYYRGSGPRSPSDSWFSRLYIDRYQQMWLSYNGRGIERFDPHTETFYPYVPDASDPHSISSDAMSSNGGDTDGIFLEDSQGRLWIGTNGGVNLYVRERDAFQSFRHDPANPASLSHDQVEDLIEAADGSIWIATSMGLNRLDPETGKVERCRYGRSQGFRMEAQKLQVLLELDDGSLWMGTESSGVLIVENPGDPEAPVLQLIDQPLRPDNLPTISDLCITSWGDVFAATFHGLYRITRNGSGYQARLYQASRGVRINMVMEDSKGNVWATSNDDLQHGLMRIPAGSDRLEVFSGDDGDPYMFRGAHVSGLLESRTGLLWIGTDKQGAYFVDLNARQFKIIDDHPQREYYLSSPEVYSILEDQQRQLYVGTKQELNRINLDQGSTFGFNNRYDLKRNVPYEYSRELPARFIGVMSAMPDGRIWMGAFDYKASLYDPSSGRFLNFHLSEYDSSAFQLWSLRSICVTSKQEVYFGGTDNGLCKLREDGLSFQYYDPVELGDPSGPSDGHIQYITEDREGILWLGTMNNGLNRFDPETGEFIHMVHHPDKPASISSNRIKCILEPEIGDPEILWVGTQSGGLNRYDRSSGRFSAITMKEGLPSNTIHGILEDKAGNLWMSTNRGLVQYDPLTGGMSVYTTDDGLSGNEFNEGAFFKNREGIMYFGGARGITWFNPEEIKEKPEVDAPVVFTGFSVSGKPVLPGDTINQKVLLERSISFTSELVLSHRERFIGFEFTSPDIAAANKLKYRYILEGFEDNWNKVDAGQRSISYSNIPPGSYSLKVMGSNSDGTRFNPPTVLELEILPPFWQTSFFRLALFISIILLFLAILQVRTRILQNQKRNLMKEVEERTHELKEANQLLEDRNTEIQSMAQRLHESDQMKLKFFTNISHEFRTPLTLIMGPTEKLLRRKEIIKYPEVRQELELIYRNERRLYKLINQLLEVRRVETGNLRLSVAEDDLIGYLRQIHQLFMPYAEKKSIDFSFDSNPSELNILFDADKVEKIFYNLLSNAFKYTPREGEIVLSCDEVIKEGKDWIRISVKDSGPGIPKDYLPHLFDRFYLVSNKHQSARISSGIGLSLSRDLVEKHHGHIEVISEERMGTRFEVYLPSDQESYSSGEILIDAEKDLQMEYIPSMLESYESGIEWRNDQLLVGEDLFRILVVEDNPDLQKFLYSEMSDLYQVMVATNGMEGLEKVGESLPDLIISDIMMPEMDGLEFCRRIKAEERTSHIPVILLTAKSGQENQLSGLETGADDYITKPFNPEGLKLKVRNLLETRKQLAEKFSSTASYIPENIQISQIDQGFLEKFIKLVEDNIDDTDLSGDVLACELGMSKGNLYKKLKSLTGMTVNIFIRTIRLKVAARLLEQGTYNISEVAYAVGFNNPKYFSTCFSEMYKVSPKEYMK